VSFPLKKQCARHVQLRQAFGSLGPRSRHFFRGPRYTLTLAENMSTKPKLRRAIGFNMVISPIGISLGRSDATADKLCCTLSKAVKSGLGAILGY